MLDRALSFRPLRGFQGGVRGGLPDRAVTFRSAGRLALAAASLLAYTAPALAERDRYSGAPLAPQDERELPSPITDRFYVRASFFSPSVQTSLRVDSSAGDPGTFVSAEKDLGLRGRAYQGRVELMFRLGGRNRLRVDYYESDRSGSTALTRNVNFADQSFLAGDVAATSLDLRMFGLTYTYSFLKRDRFELGGGLGVYLMQGDARGQVPARRLSQEVSGVAAFPSLALDGTWRISSRFAFVARGQYLKATVDGNSGSIGDYHADFQYRWRPNFAVGVGFSSMKVLLDVDGGSFPGLVHFAANGPEAFFRVSF